MFPKYRRYAVALAALAVLAISAFIVGCGPADRSMATVNPEPVAATPEGVSPQSDGTNEQADLPPLPPKEPPEYPNLDSNLNRLAGVASSTLTPASTDAAPSSSDDEPVLVTFYVEADHVDDVREYLEENDIFVRNVGEDYIEAHVPPSQLGAASEQPGVLRVDTVVPPRSQQTQIRIISQGVGLHGADAWHNAGYRGNGVKVGVIDSGFEGFRRLQGSELPSNVTALCYFETARAPSSQLSDCEVDGDHGTAVAETVIDVAPDAQLYISQPISPGDLRNAVDWMTGQGVMVINLSLGYLPDGPGDGTSPFSVSPLRTIDVAVDSGITWVIAAGNNARNVWYGTFSDGDSDGTHNFKLDDEGNTFEIFEGERIIAFMRWDDDWGHADCDLDLGLFRINPETRNWEGIAVDTTPQDGSGGSYPFAGVIVDEVSADIEGQVFLTIRKTTCANEPRWIQLTTWADGYLEHYSPGHHMANPGESRNPGALVVGASHYWDTNAIAPYSSRGPTIDGRIKPDITGIACGQSSVITPVLVADGTQCWFAGTSQAAPHVAGLAALVKQRFTNYTPDFIAHYLKQNAAERGSAGADNTWGYGLAELPDPSLAAVSIAAGPASNITAVNGRSTGEAVIAWDPAPGATHYRIGCVNMERDYPKAKASNTGNWREAFLYFDVEAQNLDPIRPTYSFPGLQEGVYHACTVLSNSSRYGQPTWPEAPNYWQYLTITNRGGACPICAATSP